jgi:hypothetical protein
MISKMLLGHRGRNGTFTEALRLSRGFSSIIFWCILSYLAMFSGVLGLGVGATLSSLQALVPPTLLYQTVLKYIPTKCDLYAVIRVELEVRVRVFYLTECYI